MHTDVHTPETLQVCLRAATVQVYIHPRLGSIHAPGTCGCTYTRDCSGDCRPFRCVYTRDFAGVCAVDFAGARALETLVLHALEHVQVSIHLRLAAILNQRRAAGEADGVAWLSGQATTYPIGRIEKRGFFCFFFLTICLSFSHGSLLGCLIVYSNLSACLPSSCSHTPSFPFLSFSLTLFHSQRFLSLMFLPLLPSSNLALSSLRIQSVFLSFLVVFHFFLLLLDHVTDPEASLSLSLPFLPSHSLSSSCSSPAFSLSFFFLSPRCLDLFFFPRGCRRKTLSSF